MSQPPTSYRIEARTVEGARAEATAASTTIVFDAGWGGEVPSRLPGPAELLASAFAACLLKNIERSSQLMPFSYEAAEVVVIAHRQDSPPLFTGIEYRLQVVTDEPDDRLDLLHRNLRKFGTVYNTLARACQVDGEITKLPREG